MAKVILVGTDVALLEGLAQTLTGFGHEVLFAATVGEVAGALNEDRPALAVVSSEALEDEGLGTTLPITTECVAPVQLGTVLGRPWSASWPISAK